MGCCCSKDDAVEVRPLIPKTKARKKLLLLGTCSSGKSTVLKKFKEANGQPLMDELIECETRNTMRFHVVEAMHCLCERSVLLTEKGFDACAVDAIEDVMDAVSIVSRFGGQKSIEANDTFPKLAKAVADLWSLPSIRATHDICGLFAEENMDFFFDKCEAIFEEDYTVTREDVLKTHVRNHDEDSYTYETDNEIFEIVDVCGLLQNRVAWKYQYEDVSAVLFVAALNQFNTRMLEDENYNAMHDALEVFECIVNAKKYFEQSEIILFLNKDDLFRDALANGETLSDCFSQEFYWEGVCWNDDDNPQPAAEDGADADAIEEYYQKSLRFVRSRFLECIREPQTVYTHVLCATQSQAMGSLLSDVQNIVTHANLRTDDAVLTTVTLNNLNAAAVTSFQ